MCKKFISFLLVALVLVFAASSVLAVKGIEKEKQSLVKVGSSIVVPQGSDYKSVVSVGGSVSIHGRVAEDVVSVGGSVILKNSARVGGDAVSVGGSVIREPGAVVKGEVVEMNAPIVSPIVCLASRENIVRGWAFMGILNFIGFIILTLIVVSLFTPQLGSVSSSIEKHWLNNLWIGLLLFILVIPIALILAISLVGIVLIPVWIILVVAAGLFGYFAAAHVLGKKVLHIFRIFGESMLVETLTGVILLCLVGLVPILGALVKAIAALCGLGAAYWTRFGTRA